MKNLLILPLILSLAACASSTQFFAGQQLVVTAAEKVADEQLAVARFNLCNVPSVGAWMRAYGTDLAKADAWRVLCATPVTQSPAKGN
jgi:hypothetical protein